MSAPHDPGDLGAHALGLLGPVEAYAMDQHLTGCPSCRAEWTQLRETAQVLQSVPPEMFRDGPPENDLLLRRTLRQIRRESAAGVARRRLGVALAAVTVGAALLGVGTAVGHSLAPPPVVIAEPPPPAPVAPGTLSLHGTDGSVTMTATITPARGWVRVAATVNGIPSGEKCSLVVVAKDGTEHVAGSWLTTFPGPAPGAPPVQGSAIIDPAQVKAVAVRNDTGRTFVTATV